MHYNRLVSDSINGDVMAEDDLVRVKLFENIEAARLAISVLKENGINAQINDEEGTFDLGLNDDPETEVIVRRADLERAQELVEQLEIPEDEICPAWTCKKCGEDVDEGFYTCWSCGAEYDPATGTIE
ncbi:MAG: hypothetical protein AAF456_11825 [Planctomycetota bacterium]